MSLYDYSIYLARPTSADSIRHQLEHGGLISQNDDSLGIRFLTNTRAILSQLTITAGTGTEIEVLGLLVEDDDSKLLTSSFTLFTDWIFSAARTADLSTLFIPGGSDVKDAWQADPESLAKFLTPLLHGGTITVAHALMYFSNRLANRLCETAHPSYRKVSDPALGCLYALVDVEENGAFDVLEPGPESFTLLSSWKK